MSADLVTQGPNLAFLVRNFALQEFMQEQISARVTYDNLTIPAAVCEWLHNNEVIWKPWISTYEGWAQPTAASSAPASFIVITISSVVPLGVAVAAAVVILGYLKQGKKRQELKIAPAGVVALVFTDIQVIMQLFDA